jgi:dTDP-4-dehydrorhamnose 3,5-epimerase
MRSRIVGVDFRSLDPHQDERGTLTEIFRQDWFKEEPPIQWNLVRSRPRVLRGVHCHIRHTDFLSVIEGELILGIVDIRRNSPTFMVAELHRVPSGGEVVAIPRGVAHGFYFEIPTTMVYGVSRYWNHDDELGCRWDDPEIRVAWPCSDPDLSSRDEVAGSLEQLINDVTKGIEQLDFERENS